MIPAPVPSTESRPPIVPVQIAYRGFQYNLSVEWIHDSLERGLRDGSVRRPSITAWPSDQPIFLHYTVERLERWREQFRQGHRIEIARALWGDIDRVLGVYGPEWDRV